MSQLLIIGDANPTIGKEISYRVSSVNLGGLSGISINHEPIKWHICVLEHGQWRKTSENSKQGETVIYTFTQSSLSRKGIKLIATRGNEKGEVIIKTKRANEPKILKVELLDINYNKVTKPLNYMDSLIAKAHCTDMEGEKLYFTLWEDDAPKAGHNLMNQMNRINPIPVPAIVKRGKAEAKFNMASYTMASMIANMHLAKGDRSEGKTHEYYVTADYYGKLQASNNINIRNENSSSPFDFLNPALPASKPKDPNAPNKPSAPPPPAPKKGTYKTAVTPKAKTKRPDAKGKIISAEFIDLLGRPYQQMKFGTQVNAKIITKNMKGKTIKLRIWEDDVSNQQVFENDYVVTDDESYVKIKLAEYMRNKGEDWKEGSEQEYFLEIEYAGQSVDSEVLNVNDSAPKLKVDAGVSMQEVGKAKVEKKDEKKDRECKCCRIDEEIFFTNYHKEFPRRDKKGNLLPMKESLKESLRKIFKGIKEYYSAERQDCDARKIAYMLATAKHETAHTFDPIKEYGGKIYHEGMYDPILGKNEKRRIMALKNENTKQGDGVKYCGRGFVQLTWKKNYRKMGEKFTVDLVNFPEKALEHDIAIKIMIYGSEKGTFTGKSLDDYINSDQTDYYNARRVINGTDKATTIQGYSEKIEKCLKIKKCKD